MTKQLSSYKLPYDIGLEQGLIGAVLLDSTAINRVYAILFVDAFGNAPHREIWAAIVELYKESAPIDFITVTNKLKAMGKLAEAGGPHYLVEITNKVASSANIEWHARIVLEKWIRRQLVKNCLENAKKAQDESFDALALLGSAQVELMQISAFATVGAGKRTPELVDGILQTLLSGEKPSEYWHVGISHLDRIMGGFLPGEECIIAGRPGSGKTTLAISMFINLARNGTPTAFFTYEMTSEELMYKLFSNDAEIDNMKFKPKDKETPVADNFTNFEKQALRASAKEVKSLPLWIEDGGGMDALQLRAKIISMKAQYNIRVFFIDYLQLMPNIPGMERKSTHDALGETTRLLKALAKETGVAIIALSQLSKDTEKNKFARPIMSNLRDSGKLEDNADRILFVWRPHYHEYATVEDKHGDIDTWGKACIIQAKFRHGSVGETWLRAQLEYSKFKNLETPYHQRIDDLEWEEIDSKQLTKSNGQSQGGQFGNDVPF